MLAPPGCDRPQHRLTLVPSAGIEAGGTVLAPGVAHRLIAPLAVALGRGQRADPQAASGRPPLATDPSGGPP